MLLTETTPWQRPSPLPQLKLKVSRFEQFEIWQLVDNQWEMLGYFQDLDVATCARILECTEGTVKSQTAKALKRLKELMTEETGSS